MRKSFVLVLGVAILAVALLAFVARPSIEDDFEHAAQSGDVATVEQLINRKPDLVRTPYWKGNTALHIAAADGDWELAQLLLEKGAEVDARNSNGRTPLYFAAESSYNTIAKSLIEHGADIFAKDRRGFEIRRQPDYIRWYEDAKKVRSSAKRPL